MTAPFDVVADRLSRHDRERRQAEARRRAAIRIIGAIDSMVVESDQDLREALAEWRELLHWCAAEGRPEL